MSANAKEKPGQTSSAYSVSRSLESIMGFLLETSQTHTAIKTFVNIQTSGNRVSTQNCCKANATLTLGQGTSTWYKISQENTSVQEEMEMKREGPLLGLSREMLLPINGAMILNLHTILLICYEQVYDNTALQPSLHTKNSHFWCYIHFSRCNQKEFTV